MNLEHSRGAMLLLLVAVLLPTSAMAQYDPYIQIDEGSVICRQGILGPTSGPLIAYDAWWT